MTKSMTWLKLALGLGVLFNTLDLKAAELEFKGITERSIKELRSSLEFDAKDVSPATVDQILRLLYGSGQYEYLEVRESKTSRHVWTLLGAPIRKINNITIRGTLRQSEGDIREVLEIESGQRFDRALLTERAERIRQFYGDRGFLNTTLEMTFKEPSPGALDVEISIDEGSVCSLRSIKFQTTNSELEEQLGRLTKKFLGRPVANELPSVVLQELNSFLADNRYLASRVSAPDLRLADDRKSAELIFSIDRPFRYNLLFNGNESLSSGTIIDSLELNKPNQVGTNPITEIQGKIETLYRTRGYTHIRVTHREKVLATEFIRQVVFEISEGPRVRLSALNFTGTLTRPNDSYSQFVKTHSSPLIEEGFFNRDDLEIGFKNLIIELQNQGFLKARIISSRVEYDRGRGRATVNVQLDEGAITRLKSVSFKGNNALSTETLREILNLKSGSALALSTLEAGLEKIKEAYDSRGHLDMKFLSEKNEIVTYDEATGEASVMIELHEGPAVKVQSIQIEGNDFTKDFVVERELEFQIGDTLTPKMIDDSLYRLQRLGLFGTVEIKTLEAGTEVASRTVIVRVSERDPGLFNFGLGVNTEFNFTVRGYTGLSYQNIGGTARALSARLELKRITDINFFDQRITAGYLEPYIFGTRFRGRVNLSRFNSIINRFRTPFVEAREGTELENNLERDFSKHYRLIWNAYSISFLKDYQLSSPNPGSTQVIGFFGPTFEIDFRDNQFLPRKGFYSRWAIEYADPLLGSLRTIQYLRTNAAINYYVPLWDSRLIFAQSLRGGYVSNFAENGFIPDIKQFFLGGRSSIRGFNVGTIPPRQGFAGDDTSTLVPTQVRTDSHFYVAQTELRVPFKGNVEGVLFYDGGAVLISGFNFGNPYRHSVGLGIRYNTPVGALSAEYGWALDRRDNEPVGVLNVSIGTF